MADRIQMRRDIAANWINANPTLAQGEFGIETDTDRVKIGNGIDDWSSLPYSFESSLVESPIGTFTFTNENGQVVTWNSVTNTIPNHDELGNLTGDDHPQYLNETRADTRYYTKSEIDSSQSVQDSVISDVSADLSQEILDRIDANNVINSNVSNNTTSISTTNANLNQEILDRTSEDVNLQSQISNNSANITQEVLDRSNGDTALQSQITTNSGDISNNSLSISQNINDIVTTNTLINELTLNQDDLVTLSGVAENSENMGSYNGSIIPNNETIKENIQTLEDYSEQLNIDKYDASNPNNYETPTQLDVRDTNNRNRTNHTGTQVASTISDFNDAVSLYLNRQHQQNEVTTSTNSSSPIVRDTLIATTNSSGNYLVTGYMELARSVNWNDMRADLVINGVVVSEFSMQQAQGSDQRNDLTLKHILNKTSSGTETIQIRYWLENSNGTTTVYKSIITIERWN